MKYLMVAGMVVIWSSVAVAVVYGVYYNIKHPFTLSTETRPLPKK